MFVTLIGKDQFSKDKRIEKFLAETLGDRISDPMAKQVLYATTPKQYRHHQQN